MKALLFNTKKLGNYYVSQSGTTYITRQVTKYEFAHSLALTSGNPDFLLHFHKDEDDDCYEQNRTKINAKVFRVVKQSCVVVVAAGTNRDVAAVVAVSVVAFSGALSF